MRALPALLVAAIAGAAALFFLSRAGGKAEPMPVLVLMKEGQQIIIPDARISGDELFLDVKDEKGALVFRAKWTDALIAFAREGGFPQQAGTTAEPGK